MCVHRRDANASCGGIIHEVTVNMQICDYSTGHEKSTADIYVKHIRRQQMPDLHVWGVVNIQPELSVCFIVGLCRVWHSIIA